MRRRAMLAVAVALLAGCAAQDPTVPDGGPGGGSGWQRVDDLPLSARTPGVAAWTGAGVVVVGGDAGPPCPPNASCVLPERHESDGALLDPGTGRWQPITDAPTPIGPGAPHAVVDGLVFVVVTPPSQDSAWRLLSYDPAADAWTRWKDVPDVTWSALAAYDGRVILYDASHEGGDPDPDHELDPATGGWTALPADPLGRTFDRLLTSTPHGLVLTAKGLVPDPGPGEPSLVLAALWDGGTRTWARLPDTDQFGGYRWTWTGRHLLDPSLGVADGGEIDSWGRTVPEGGILELPAGTWRPLPDPPRQTVGETCPLPQALGGRYSTTSGYLYDDEQETWTHLVPPAGSPEEPGTTLWAGDELVLLGGTDWGEPRGTRSAGAWLYAP